MNVISYNHHNHRHVYALASNDGVEATLLLDVSYARLVVEGEVSLEAKCTASFWSVTVCSWTEGKGWSQAGTHSSSPGWVPTVRALERCGDVRDVAGFLEQCHHDGAGAIAKEVLRHEECLGDRQRAQQTLATIRKEKERLLKILDPLEAVDDYRYLIKVGDTDHAASLQCRSLRTAPIAQRCNTKGVSLVDAKRQLSSAIRKQREVERSRHPAVHTAEAVARIVSYLPDSRIIELRGACKAWRQAITQSTHLAPRLMPLQGEHSSWAFLKTTLHSDALCKLKESIVHTNKTFARTWIVGSQAGILTFRRITTLDNSCIINSLSTQECSLEVHHTHSSSIRFQGRWVVVPGYTLPFAPLYEAALWVKRLCEAVSCSPEQFMDALGALGIVFPTGFPSGVLGSEGVARLRVDTVKWLLLPAVGRLDAFAAEHHVALFLEAPSETLLNLYHDTKALQDTITKQTESLMAHRVYGKRLGDVLEEPLFANLKHFRETPSREVMEAAEAVTTQARGETFG